MAIAEIPPSSSGRSASEVAQQAVYDAGDIIRSQFLQDIYIEHKGRGNVVTNVDLLVEKQMLAFLRDEYPDVGVVSEESEEVKGSSPYRWIADPVDGTRNFASGLPLFSVALALVHYNEPVLGMIYDPIRNELFHAEVGAGAYLNESPIRVSNKTSVEESIVALDMGYDDRRAQQALELLLALWPGMQTIRILGSAALGMAYAACGRVDIYFHHLLSPWDLAGGILLLKEAGGTITDREGGPMTLDSAGTIATNSAIHQDFFEKTRGLPWDGLIP